MTEEPLRDEDMTTASPLGHPGPGLGGDSDGTDGGDTDGTDGGDSDGTDGDGTDGGDSDGTDGTDGDSDGTDS